MSETVSELSSAEPACAPYLRFARNVLIVDIVMGVAVLLLSLNRGWTSLGESTTAIFGGGAVLLGMAILPIAGPWLSMNFYTPVSSSAMNGYARFHAMAGRDDLMAMHPRATATLLVAGAIPIAYAGIVNALFL